MPARSATDDRPGVPLLALAFAFACAFASSCSCSSRTVAPPAGPPAPAELAYSIELPGRSSIEMDRELAVPVELALRTVPGIARLELFSRSGRLHIRCVLAPNAAPESMRGPIVTRLTDVLAPTGATALAVRATSSDLARMAYTVGTTGVESRALAAWHDATFPLIQGLPGLDTVESCGAPRAEVLVALDPARLAARAVGLEDVIGPLQGTFESLGAVAALDLGGVTPVPVSEVAQVTESAAPLRCRALRDGVPVLLVESRIDPGADPAQTRADVNARLGSVPAPLGLRFESYTPSGPVATLALVTPPGASWDDSSRMALMATQALQRVPGVAHVFARIGASDLAPVGARETDLEVELALSPADVAGRVTLERTLVATLRALPGLQVRVQDGVLPERTVRVVGDDLDAAARVAELLGQTLRAMPGVEDAGVLDAGREPVAALQIDRARAGEAGLAEGVIERAVTAATEGIVAGSMVTGFRRLPIRVVLGTAPVAASAIPPDLVVPVRGGSVPLAGLATIQRSDVPETVGRQDGHRMVRVFARLSNDSTWPTLRAATEQAVRPPPGVTIVWD